MEGIKVPRVLVADDESEVRTGVGHWLSDAGFSYSTAADGDEVCTALADNPPDAVVLDLRMPHKDGLTTLRELQANDRTRRIPVVVLTARPIEGQRALELGARYFIAKPYVGEKLVEAVRMALTECANSEE